MAIKPFPRLILIVSAVAAIGFGINALNSSGAFSGLKSSATAPGEESVRRYPQGVSTPPVVPLKDQPVPPEPPAPVAQNQEPQSAPVPSPTHTSTPDAGLQKLLGAGAKK